LRTNHRQRGASTLDQRGRPKYAVALTFVRVVIQAEPFFCLTSSIHHLADDQQIQMVVKQQAILSNDIETNPGPFFEQCYKVVTEFCNGENNDNDFYLRTCVDQLTANQSQANPIPFPEDFLTDDKVDIWRKCELKIKRNTAFDDRFRKALQNIWHFWFQASFQNDLSNSRKAIHQSLNPKFDSIKPVGDDAKSMSVKSPIEQMSISFLDKEKKRCGFYKYARSTDSSKFFCLDGKCKNSKYKNEGVKRETLRNHAKKTHLIDINFQTKTADIIGEVLKCILCNKVFSRNQTFVNHQRRYHPDLSSSTTNGMDRTENRNSNNLQEATTINQISSMNFLTTSNNDVLQINKASTPLMIHPQTVSKHQVTTSENTDNQLSSSSNTFTDILSDDIPTHPISDDEFHRLLYQPF